MVENVPCSDETTVSEKADALMFMGQFSHSLDEKGRLIIPSKYRDELGREFVVAAGYDTCLYAYSKAEWQRFAAEIEELPEKSRLNRMKRRRFLSSATDVEMDRQGRVLIPGFLRDAAKIDKDIVIAGIGRKLEIWDKGLWEESLNSEEMEAIAGGYDEEDDDRPDTSSR
ncbi:MAG: division/cell wall cluster transcriptional repressor MraZ [Lachnospiraceae bacterium]|jgi:MraZ protein|nr:division/cell wall cluster transcriptional repressor MraZ [Lachnospiraceae bacterium]